MEVHSYIYMVPSVIDVGHVVSVPYTETVTDQEGAISITAMPFVSLYAYIVSSMRTHMRVAPHISLYSFYFVCASLLDLCTHSTPQSILSLSFDKSAKLCISVPISLIHSLP